MSIRDVNCMIEAIEQKNGWVSNNSSLNEDYCREIAADLQLIRNQVACLVPGVPDRTVQRELERVIDDKDDTICSLEDEAYDLRERVEELEYDLDEKQGDCNYLEEQYEEAKWDSEGYQERIAELENTICDLESSNETNESAVYDAAEALEEAMGSLNETFFDSCY